MNPREIDDALHAQVNGADGMAVQILAQIRDSLSAINRKQDTISRDVSSASERIARLEERNERVSRIEETVRAMGIEVNALAADKDRRDGASGFAGLLLKSPALGWLVGAAISAWAILTGKVHP